MRRTSVGHQGASLVEVLIAVALLVTSISVASTLFPSLVRSSMEGRRRWQASELAQSRIEEIKSMAYGLIPMTVETYPPFNNAGGAQCDCRTVDFNWLTPVTRTIGNVTYEVRTCVTLMKVNNAGALESECSNNQNNDTGLKYSRVQVRWPGTDGNFSSTEAEAFISG